MKLALGWLANLEVADKCPHPYASEFWIVQALVGAAIVAWTALERRRSYLPLLVSITWSALVAIAWWLRFHGECEWNVAIRMELGQAYFEQLRFAAILPVILCTIAMWVCRR